MNMGEWALHYTVKHGDTVYGICAGILITAQYPLQVENTTRPGSDLDLIYPGEVLFITSHKHSHPLTRCVNAVKEYITRPMLDRRKIYRRSIECLMHDRRGIVRGGGICTCGGRRKTVDGRKAVDRRRI